MKSLKNLIKQILLLFDYKISLTLISVRVQLLEKQTSSEMLVLMKVAR